ncbi:hypothetical protein EV1_017848 [Malus domestica]
MSSTGRSGRFPFTPSQWQELEHQALIYKYMVSGISIPPDLLFSLKRSSCSLDSPLPPKIFSHHPPHIGWNCFPMGLGRKIDPEPGRCRRTDGKKWRCSKEAFLDSKYCERHMHRGKNRSRKPVEVLKTPPISTPKSSNTSTSTTKINACSASPSPAAFHSLSSSLSSLSSSDSHPYPFLYHHHSPSSRPPGIGFPHQERNTTSLFLDSGSYPQPSSEYRNRYAYGMKEEVDEHAFFSEPSGTVRGFSGSSSMDDSWQFTPLTISTSSSSKQRSCSAFQSDQQDQQLRSIKHQKQDHHQQQQHYYAMDRNEGSQKTVHRFFDEWPPKDKDSWLDLDDKSSNSGSVSTTRLSISIPTSGHDFPVFTSRHHNNPVEIFV